MNAPSPVASRTDGAWTHALARHPWRVVCAVLAIAIVLLLVFWDWNWVKHPLERRVQATTGRAFRIGGDLDVDLGRVTTVTMDDVHFANADWSKQPEMASARRVTLRFALWPALIAHRFDIDGLRLDQPRLLMELGPQGMGNWSFGDASQPAPKIGNLWIDAGQLRYLDVRGNSDVTIALRSRAAKNSAHTPVASVDGQGRWKGNPLTLVGTVESPLELRNTDKPFRINLDATSRRTHAHARGTLLDPLRLRDFDLRLALSGQNLDDLYRLIGVSLPPTPPYALEGRFTRTVNNPTSSTWKYDGFSGKVGNSDLAGSAQVTTGKRLSLTADLHSQRLNFDDLAGFVGGAPRAGASGRTTQAAATTHAASGSLLPSTPYDLTKLRNMDADVRLRAAHVNAITLPIDNMDAHMLLKNGDLRLDPLNFGIAGGTLTSSIRMQADRTPIRTRANITARGMDLPRLLPTLELAKTAVGKVGGRIDITTSGNSIAAMAGSADGHVAVGMGSGHISKLLMKYAGLDLAGILKIKLTHDEQVPIRCVVGAFDVDNGVMRSKALFFDTDTSILVGSGSVNLRDETLDLTINPHSKGRSLLSLRSPLYVTGTFRHPDVRPSYGRVALRAATAVGLGTLFAPAALLATTDLGGGRDSRCGQRAQATATAP